MIRGEELSSNDKRGHLALKKYVMLVDQDGGPLARLVPRLRELDFRVLRVPDVAGAVEFVKAFPKLSMVAINDTGNSEQNRHLLGSMRQLQPDLPLLWHGPALSLPEGEVAQLLPHDGITAGDLVASAERLLSQHFYPPDFATYLADAALAAFAGFGAHASSVDPFLKASRTRLSELNAVIAFSGHDIAGHIVVSGRRSVVAQVHMHLFGDASPPADEALVDLLGECSNRIIGKVLNYFEKQGRPFTFGLPLFLVGTQTVMWQGSPRPSLALEFEGVYGSLFAELCLDAFDPVPEAPELPSQLLQSGQCILL
jgi:CheY-specific phosphatase CheX